MKVSVIHNLYKHNPFVPESVRLNLLALEQSRIDYQYILFNDHGDRKIDDDVLEFVGQKVEYHYSPKNYGFKMCSGGWVGAQEWVRGDLIHNIGQDDVYTKQFYVDCLSELEDKEIKFVFANGFRVDENLGFKAILIHPGYTPDFTKPEERFREWFGIVNNEVTKSNNGVLAPGTIYRKELHDLIGLPDIDNFRGACDFEYWARILFNGYKGKFINKPLWLYRQSEYTAGNEIIDGKPNRGYWQQLHIKAIQEKYTRLWEEKKQLSQAEPAS